MVRITLTYGELFFYSSAVFVGMCINTFLSGFFGEWHRQRREDRERGRVGR